MTTVDAPARRAPRRAATSLTTLLFVLLPLLLAPAARGGNPEVDPVGVWPLAPRPEVVTPFDPPLTPYGAGHRGVDLAGRSGQVVRSALAGRVSFAAPVAGRGVVVVGHGATRTTYEPVSATVAVGDPVAPGAVLGRLEAAGSHCAPATCLHWGWIAGGASGEEYRDPLRLVGAGPVRLLPLWRDRPVVTPAGALAGRPVAVGPW